MFCLFPLQHKHVFVFVCCLCAAFQIRRLKTQLSTHIDRVRESTQRVEHLTQRFGIELTAVQCVHLCNCIRAFVHLHLCVCICAFAFLHLHFCICISAFAFLHCISAFAFLRLHLRFCIHICAFAFDVTCTWIFCIFHFHWHNMLLQPTNRGNAIEDEPISTRPRAACGQNTSLVPPVSKCVCGPLSCWNANFKCPCPR